MTSGGLVIYGGMIGGVGAAFVYLLIKRAPVLAIADIMAPSLALGLALGRLGCFFNGCCFGGACEYPWAVTFPYASPPYVDQYQKDKLPTPATLFKHDSGGLQPIELRVNENGRPIVYYVHPKAEFQGSTPRRGEVVTDINGRKIESYRQAAAILLSDPPPFRLKTAAGREVSWSKLIEPPRSLPIHPTQIYSTINGIFMALVFWFAYPYRRRDGSIFATLLIVYPITRFVLEIIRTDEGAIGQTGLTISQNVSIVMLLAGVALWIYILRRPAGSVLPPPAATGSGGKAAPAAASS